MQRCYVRHKHLQQQASACKVFLAGTDLRLVYVVHLEGLQDLGLYEVADAGLGHDGNGHRGLDCPDDLWRRSSERRRPPSGYRPARAPGPSQPQRQPPLRW